MTEPRVLALAAIGVVFLRSPNYLAETIADAVDAKMLDARDEGRFWRTAVRAYELRQSELPELQARIARKYCRNLDIWGALPRLRERYQLVLVHGGPSVILDCWRGEYDLAGRFDLIVEAAPHGLLTRDAALYELTAGDAGVPVEACAVVEATLAGYEAAAAAGLRAYRYGTAYGLQRWLSAGAGDEGQKVR
ncbi:MAG TPA: hypothetical protein VKV26_22200 [Dehalococcoidia bacterium]|nr:hypothetical protein [Dehalococcoidia bacterium]